MKITVKTSTCDINLEVTPSSTVENVKDNIQVKTGIHRRFQKLSFSNKELKDGCILSDYRIENSTSVDFQLIVASFDEPPDFASWFIRSVANPKLCADTLNNGVKERVGLYSCGSDHEVHLTQRFVLSWHKDIRSHKWVLCFGEVKNYFKIVSSIRFSKGHTVGMYPTHRRMPKYYFTIVMVQVVTNSGNITLYV